MMAVARRAALIVLDGLRPDFVTPELTPNLARLRDQGTWFDRNHAVVPTVTRTNAATLARGTLPAGHGLPANLLYAPLVDRDAVISLGEDGTVPALMEAYGVFAAPTLADAVGNAGRVTALLSTGTRGSALMLDPRRERRGHVTLHPTLSTPDELATATSRFGPLPEAAVPDSGRNAWLARAAAEWVVPDVRPDLLMIWFDDPDKSQHRFGLGHPESLRAIREVDAHVGRIYEAFDVAGLREDTVVAVASDHGYVGVRRHVDLGERLAGAGLDRTTDGSPVVVAPNGCAVLIYAPGGTDADVERLAGAVLGWPEVAAVFTGRDDRPPADGTFPLAYLGAGGPLAPDLVVSLAWDDEANEHGYRGVSDENGSANRAGHGGASPWEIRNTMLLAGPGVRRGARSLLPSGNVDLAPTLLSLLGLLPPGATDGRVLSEALLGTVNAGAELPTEARERVEHRHGASEIAWSHYAGRRYLTGVRRVSRT